MPVVLIVGIIIVVIAVVVVFFSLKKGKKKKEKVPVKEQVIFQNINAEELLNETTNKTPISEDTLDLDDLFKTISMTAIKDDSNFDFGLKKQGNK